MLNEQEITKIIKSWQKCRIEDFQIQGKFNTGRVIAQRKRISGQTLEEVRDFLEMFQLEVSDDFIVSDILKKKKEEDFKVPMIDLTNVVPPEKAKEYMKEIKKRTGNLLTKWSN